VFLALSTTSFFSVWYWALLVVVWTQACHRTLGVPYDMILRAERVPAVAGQVDLLAGIWSGRLAGISRNLGVPAAALGGFALAAVATLGFGSGIELAQAGFMLLAPLAGVGVATVRLARAVEREGLRGPALRRRLARRRLWNHVIAAGAILAAAAVALGHAPRVTLP